ncbi:hypothetical protein B0H13DRAFT_1629982, partial [Mycena leptocephala]
KGCLSKEIERIVEEAEEFKPEDKAEAARIASRNAIVSYAYNLCDLLNDDEKLDTANKSKLKITVNETITWLDTLQEEASKEEYEERLKKMEAVATAIVELLAGVKEVN